ncbi:hypothetical protein PV326_003810 [Microctonus aethiopoides]|nr:hypothetical protein PV326_003810 [Microctonus aethiopoides]
MKCIIPEISWHNRDPVLSVDFQYSSKVTTDNKDEKFWRLATGGADSHVLIWHVEFNNGGISMTCVTELNRHQKAVNVVRFSPSGEILASGDDESVIILWKQKGNWDILPLPGDENSNKEQWSSWKVLRGHLEDVYDISWSPDSNMLVSGSVDNTAIVWDVNKGRSISILQDYKGFVQGVTWDPSNQYIATMSTDRQCRLIDLNTMKTIQRANKAKVPTSPGHRLEGKTIRLFHDDTFKSFFRRLTFTNDGLLLIVPSGIIEPEESTERPLNATIIFSRHNVKEPIMILPTLDEPTIAVRCCPVNYELRDDGPVSIIALPYRMIFAVATQKSVFLYDTQQLSPIAVVSNIHYTRLTDITWSMDGRILVVSSTDGYCSIIHFHDGELGTVYSANKPIEISKLNIDDNDEDKHIELKKTINKPYLFDIDNEAAMDVDAVTSLKNSGHSSISLTPVISELDPEQQRIHGSDNINKNKNIENKIIENPEEITEDIKLIYSEASNNECTPIIDKKDSVDEVTLVTAKSTSPKINLTSVLSAKTPRRVQLITLSSPKRTKNL